MALGLLGTKIGMTQVFGDTGNAIPVTILQLGPCIITQIKNIPSHGYESIQIGYSQQNAHNITKAELGHLEKADAPPLKYLKEYRVQSSADFHIGQEVTVSELQIGNFVKVSGLSIGKGFTGYQKRHNFSRGPMTHGSKNHRKPGSISAGTTPGRVFPGKRMAGQMGNKKVSIKNLKIIKIYKDKNIVVVKGSIPGKSGSIISVSTKE